MIDFVKKTSSRTQEPTVVHMNYNVGLCEAVPRNSERSDSISSSVLKQKGPNFGNSG